MTTIRFAAYDDQAIWGVGATELDAVNDACIGFPREFGDNNGDSLKTAPMTEALAEKVDEKGGAVAFFRLRCGHIGTFLEFQRERKDEI